MKLTAIGFLLAMAISALASPPTNPHYNPIRDDPSTDTECQEYDDRDSDYAAFIHYGGKLPAYTPPRSSIESPYDLTHVDWFYLQDADLNFCDVIDVWVGFSDLTNSNLFN